MHCCLCHRPRGIGLHLESQNTKQCSVTMLCHDGRAMCCVHAAGRQYQICFRHLPLQAGLAADVQQQPLPPLPDRIPFAQRLGIGPIYNVQSGDTLLAIAGMAKTTLKAILVTNPDVLDPERGLIPGTLICLPLCSTSPSGEYHSYSIHRVWHEYIRMNFVFLHKNCTNLASTNPKSSQTRSRIQVFFNLHFLTRCVTMHTHTCSTLRSSNQGRLAFLMRSKADFLTPLPCTCLSLWLYWAVGT